MLSTLLLNIVCNSYYPRSGTTWVMLHKGWMLSRGCSPSDNMSPRATNPCGTISWVITDLYFPSGGPFNLFSIGITVFILGQNMLHMQHHFLCNITYVVTAESMGKSLTYTTITLYYIRYKISAVSVHECTCLVSTQYQLTSQQSL